MTLRTLDAADMFDVLQVLFEEDITLKWENDNEVKDRIRTAFYPILVGEPYKYATTKVKTTSDMSVGLEEEGSFQPGEKREVKPYFPPTPDEDLMRVLDSPLG